MSFSSKDNNKKMTFSAQELHETVVKPVPNGILTQNETCSDADSVVKSMENEDSGPKSVENDIK